VKNPKAASFIDENSSSKDKSLTDNGKGQKQLSKVATMTKPRPKISVDPKKAKNSDKFIDSMQENMVNRNNGRDSDFDESVDLSQKD